MRFGLPILLLAACSAIAQQAVPAFNVASVKQNHSGSTAMGGNSAIGPGGKLSMRNIPVRTLIATAYDLQDYQIGRTPGWTDTAGYDIEARPENPVDDATARSMMQNMLAERFHLRVHRENSTVTGFRLVADKSGSKLKPSEAPDIGFRKMWAEEFEGPGDMRSLAVVLAMFLHSPVDDQTKLTGKYDIHVKWSRDDNGSATEPTMSLFTALKLQLGLSLESAKVPIGMLMIDGGRETNR